MTRQVALTVNGAPIAIDYFVEEFIDHTIGGMLEALEGTGPVKTAEIAVEGEKVTINLNQKVVPVNAFASKIVRSTVFGMVASLKGVSDIKSLKLSVKR